MFRRLAISAFVMVVLGAPLASAQDLYVYPN